MFILPILSHRSATAEAHVYIGRHAIIGASHLADDRLIGNRASILSSKALHELGEDGMWAACPPRLATVKLDKIVWIGKGAIIAADVGEGSMVGAGSVVTTKVKSHIIVTGNPARFVKKLDN